MHFANIKKSIRLRKTLDVLKDKRLHTTADIRRVTKSVAVHSDISEVRANGYIIHCWDTGVRTKTGNKVFVYLLIGKL